MKRQKEACVSSIKLDIRASKALEQKTLSLAE